MLHPINSYRYRGTYSSEPHFTYRRVISQWRILGGTIADRLV